MQEWMIMFQDNKALKHRKFSQWRSEQGSDPLEAILLVFPSCWRGSDPFSDRLSVSGPECVLFGGSVSILGEENRTSP